MTIQVQELLMCAIVYSGIAVVGFYFVAKERRAARLAQGHQQTSRPIVKGGFVVAKQAYTIEESEPPHRTL
jgi:hypothetical protein